MSVEDKIITNSYTTSKLVEPTQVQNNESEPRREWSEEDIDTLNTIIAHEQNQREWGKEINPSIPWDRATMSWEYRKCRGQNCKCRFGGDFRHGPYLVMVWKDLDSKCLNKVKKKYLGKSKDGDMNVYNVLSDLSSKKNVFSGLVDRDCTVTKLKKCMDIMKAEENGNKLAQEYNQKLKNSKVSVDWAYKKVFKLNQTKNKELI